MLQFHLTQAIEPFLICIFKQAERIPEPQRRLCSHFLLESLHYGLSRLIDGESQRVNDAAERTHQNARKGREKEEKGHG